MENSYTQYLTHLTYFATGEGFFYQIRFCYADSDTEAKQKHLDEFFDNDASKNYFGAGIEVLKWNTKDAKEILSKLIVNGDMLHETLKVAGQEMSFVVRYNYS